MLDTLHNSFIIIIMGMHTYTRIGVYIDLGKGRKKTTITEPVRVCTECAGEDHTMTAKYCQGCGALLKTVDVEIEEDLALYEVLAAIGEDNDIFAIAGEDDILFPNSLLAEVEFSDLEGGALEITPKMIADALKEFDTYYGHVMEKFKEYYPDHKVMFGAVAYYS